MGLKEAWDTAGLFVPMPLVGKAGVKTLIVAAPAGTAAAGAIAHAVWMILAGMIALTLAVLVGAFYFMRREFTAVPLRPSRQHIAAPGQAAALARAQMVPAGGEVHHHYGETHTHDHREIHVHQAPAAVEAAQERAAIAPRAAVPGVVLKRRDEARLRP